MMQTQFSQIMIKTDGNNNNNNSLDKNVNQLGRLLTPSSDLINFNKT